MIRKNLYISLLILAAIAAAGCNPGIMPIPQPPATDVSAYFFPKNINGDLIFRDSASGRQTFMVKVSTSQHAANNFFIAESGLTADSLDCSIDSISVKLSGLSVNSIIPIPDGYRIKPDSTLATEYTFPMINHLIASPRAIVAASNTAGMFFSSDAGATWKPSSFSAGDSVTALVSVNDAFIFAGTQSGKIYVTSNGGASWIPFQGWNSQSVKPIQALTFNSNELYVSYGSIVYKVEINGMTSTPLTSRNSLDFSSLAITEKTNGDTLLLGGSSYGLRYLSLQSDSIGWQTADGLLSKAQITSLLPTSKGKIFCTTSGNTYISSNGIQWDSLNISIPSGIMADNNGIVLGVSPSGTTLLYNDTGAFISQAPTIPAKIHDLTAINSSFFAGTDNGIYSIREGSHWQQDSGLTVTHTTSKAESGEMTLLHSQIGGSLDSSWIADTLITSGGTPISITGRIITHYDSLTVAGKSYSDVIEVQYSNEIARMLNKSIPYLQIFYAKNEGPIVIYQITQSGTNSGTREIYRTK